MPETNENVGSNTGKLLAIGAACILILGGCLLCGGGLAVPFLLKRQAAEVEARRQAQQVEEVMRQKETTRKKESQEAGERQKPVSAGESHELD